MENTFNRSLRQVDDPVARGAGAYRRRLRALGLLWGILVAALVLRLFHLQVVQGARLARRTVFDTVVREPIETRRGRIYDSYGRPLVVNAPRFALWVLPSALRNVPQTVAGVARALQVSEASLLDRLHQHESRPDERFIWQDDLDARQFARLAEIQPDLPGVTLGARPLRRYPFGPVAAHVVGTVGEVSDEDLKRHPGYDEGDVLGKTGLERQYERDLRGARGLSQTHYDAAGRRVATTIVHPFVPGRDLKLTIDARFQQRVEAVLGATVRHLQRQNGEAQGGAVVVVDVRSGAVLAMASLPEYDPNLFAKGISASAYASLLKDRAYPLLNRCIDSAYPPGSTFKLVTGSASLEEGLCSAGTVFQCNGAFEVAGQTFHCFVRSGHGAIGFIESISQSCDVVFYELGHRLGIERLVRYARAFGVGAKTGIDLPDEDPGLLPTPAWKKKALHQPWFAGDTVNLAIGQGYLSATPLQMAMVTAAVANGGTLWRPYLVQGEGPHRVGRVPVSASDLAAVREGMRGAVTHGTATAGNSKRIALAGKTGTAENAPTADNPHGRNHAWFVGFAPYDHPEVAVAVVLEKSGGMGGQVAAPIARAAVEAWFSAQTH